MDPNIPQPEQQPMQSVMPDIQTPQPVVQPTFQQTYVNQPMQPTNFQQKDNSIKTKIVRTLKIIGFLILGFFAFYLTLNQQSFSFPLGLIVGLILLIFKAKQDRIIRLVALIIGFQLLIYSPYLLEPIAQSVLQPNGVYTELKTTYSSATLGVQTIETGSTTTLNSNMSTQTAALPSQLTLTITQDKLLTDQEIQQTAIYLCKNTHYKYVTITSIKVPIILIPLPFVNQTKSIGGHC